MPWSYTPNPDQTPAALTEFTLNRWKRGAGDSYDSSGNQTGVATRANTGASANVFTYDGENRMVTSNVAGMGQVTYSYDGEGRRVQKSWACGGSTCSTVFVYDAMGQLAAEYSTAPNPLSGTTEYLTADSLGSTRLVTDESGNVTQCYDYLPFGEEIRQGVNGRGSCYPPTGVYPHAADATSTKFTGKERDVETGLDYFGARYLSSAQGRFTSIDPVIMGPHKVSNPQNWNHYAYARNNPLRFTDPTGEIITEDIDAEYKKRYQQWKSEYLKTKAGRALWKKYQDDSNFTLTIRFGANSGGQEGAETTGYHWNESGQLNAATIILGAKLNSGYPNGENYPVTGSLRPDPGGTEPSGSTIAATKLAHEFGHVEMTAGTSQNLYGLQNFLMPVWNGVFQSTGQTSQPDIERLMGGNPVQINTMRERGAEGAGAVPFLKDRFPGKPGDKMPKRIGQAIQNYEKGK